MKRLFLLFVAAACICGGAWAAPTVLPSSDGKKVTITCTAAHEFDNWLIANPTALDGVEEVEFTSGSVMAAGDINELGKHGLDNLKKVTASGVKFTTTGGTTSITLTQIEELVMDNISIGNNQPIEIKGCTNLKTLSMKNADLSTGGRPSAMIIITDNPALTSIDMSGSQVNTSQVDNTAIQITGNDALKTINMAGTSVTPWYDHNQPNAHIVDLSDNKSLVGATLPTGITTDNVTGSEQLSWIGGVEEEITYPGGTPTTTRTLKLNVTEPGQLAEAMALLGDSDAGIDKLIVTGGPLNADDLASLNAPMVDLSGATTTAGLSNVGGSVENLMLPSGFSATDMASISSTKAPNLKVAGSLTTKDSETLPYVTPSKNEVTEKTFATTELALYSFKKNNVPAFASAFNLTDASIDKLSMAGQCGKSDLAEQKEQWGQVTTQKNFNSSNLHYFDFTGATFDELTVTANGEEVTTNSMYYLKNYNVFTCKLPTGNTDVPPEVFCTDNGGWSSPLVEIEIPNTYNKIGYKSFYGTHIKELTLPSSMESVGVEAFNTCPLLENVEMQPLSGSCTFGEKAFAGCFALKHVSLSEGVDGISNQMFYQCVMLESIRIPTTCEVIKSEAFVMCYSLHNFVIPEGVKLLEKNVFDNAGLTDVYVMATSYDKMPKIYDIGVDGNATGTFSKKNVMGNDTDPRNKHKNDIAAADDETVLTYYQEEFSDGAWGLGGGNCMVQLHYPESMSWFYNNKDIETLPYSTWSGYLTDQWVKEAIAYKMKEATEIFEGYALGCHEFYGNSNDSWPTFGPSESGKYWPTQTDYKMRLASGYTPGDEPTAEAWRQFPLQGFAKINDETFTKKYDDTWYTMCFPWDMDDNTLFSTFNQKCEITEFVGVEVFEDDDAATEDVIEYSMVFHFDRVAPTHYMDSDHNEYERVSSYVVGGQETVRTVTIQVSGKDVKKNYYAYKLISGSGDEYVYYPLNTNNNTITAQDQAMRNHYNDIKHLMVFAGRPYMIHPSIGAKTGQPKDCTVAGVQKVSLDNGETWDTYADKMKVEQPATTNGTFQSPGTKHFINPETKEGGSYFFIGNIGDGPKDMLDGREMAYFLGVKEGEVYPKYFRKTKGGEGKWSKYSAIIYPDDKALANIEHLEGMAVSSSSTGAKAFDVAFGEWEVVTPTAIEEIIADAEQSAQPVKQVHMNVVFNINGQVVRQGTSVEGLPKGLYIINGKKYMVK